MAPSIINSIIDFHSLASVGLVVLVLGLSVSLLTAVYNAYFHPLAKYPGPLLRAAFYFPDFWHIYKGTSHIAIKELHDRYGGVVRIVPDGLSYAVEEAWQDIFTVKSNKRQLEKDRNFFVDAPQNVNSIIHSSDADHARIRKLVAYAFSETALREQEPLMSGYFDLLVRKLNEQIDGQKQGVVDLTQWYNFTTFDIVGDLTIGESMKLLERERFNFWTRTVFEGIKLLRFLRVARAYPAIWWTFQAVAACSPSLAKKRNAHMNFAIQRAEKRLDTKRDRKDFMTYIVRYNDERGMTRDEITLTAAVLLIAGSETSATVLSGATYYLLKNREALKKAQCEVRQAFATQQDITFLSTAQLPYLGAVIDESIRLYPAVPGSFPRRTGPEGDMINGRFVPPDISVGVHQWSTYRDPKNFTDPELFVPERWLKDAPLKYRGDRRGALQPFHVGPRNCVGKSLANFKLRSILARMLWNFEMELCQDSLEWSDQKSFILWDKPALNVRLSHRKDVTVEVS